jgi:CRISPR/Cas system-associated exonuclease Cas4 (RecB family)
MPLLPARMVNEYQYCPQLAYLEWVQALILEEHGYTCEEGVLYFAGSRERVRVRFDDDLRCRRSTGCV